MGGAVSSGRNNDELVDNLMKGSYIRTYGVEKVFRVLDRADYMTPEAREQAYKDLAWRNGPLHLSAPCIYSEVMEALELKPGLTFLNVGSGTGYLSTLVGLVIGSSGISHGVEAVPFVHDYATTKFKQFIDNSIILDEFDFCLPRYFLANGLCLETKHMYDRVYCGAGVLGKYENYFKGLTKVGGVLVMPLEDTLVQLRRVTQTHWTRRNLLHVSFALLKEPTMLERMPFVVLDASSPPPLQVLARGCIRTAMRAGLMRRHPELMPPPPPPPRPAPRGSPRRICIPYRVSDDDDDDGGMADLNELHDMDDEGGANEMNALLSLVLSMSQNRQAGSLQLLAHTEHLDDLDDLDSESPDPSSPCPCSATSAEGGGADTQTASTSDSTKDASTSDSTNGASTSDSTKGAATSDSTKGAATSDSTKGASTSDSTKGTLTLDSTKGASTSGSSKGASTSDSTKGASTSDSTKGALTSDSTKGASTSDSPKGASTSDSMKGASTSDSMKAASISTSTQGASTSNSTKGASTTDSMKGASTSKSMNGASTSESMKGASTSDSMKGASSSKSMNGASTSDSMKGASTSDSMKGASTAGPTRGASVLAYTKSPSGSGSSIAPSTSDSTTNDSSLKDTKQKIKFSSTRLSGRIHTRRPAPSTAPEASRPPNPSSSGWLDSSSSDEDGTQVTERKRQKLDSGIGEGTASSASPDKSDDKATPSRSSKFRDSRDLNTNMPWYEDEADGDSASSSSDTDLDLDSGSDSDPDGDEVERRDRSAATRIATLRAELKRKKLPDGTPIKDVHRRLKRRAARATAAKVARAAAAAAAASAAGAAAPRACASRGGAQCCPLRRAHRPPAAARNMRRANLSLAMKRACKELPLPHDLKMYVNYGRSYQF